VILSTEKIRVVVSFLADSSLSDGCVGHTAALVKLFEREGCDVGLVSLSSKGINNAGGRVLYRAPANFWGMLLAAGASVSMTQRNRAQLLVCTSLGAPVNPLISFVAKRLGIHVLYDCQDPPIETMSLVFGRGILARILKFWVSATDAMLRRSVSWTFSVSRGVDRLLRQHNWRMPIYRFYNAHAVEQFADADGDLGFREKYGWQDASVLIYAGGLQPRIRGIEIQLEAVALARRAGANVKLIAFGAGDPELFLHIAEKLGISQDVVIHEPLPRRQLLAALRAAPQAGVSTLAVGLPTKNF
jgi:glycosyltransferase involved in cell wall biosynthesis